MERLTIEKLLGQLIADPTFAVSERYIVEAHGAKAINIFLMYADLVDELERTGQLLGPYSARQKESETK